jgi:hypothetical protein
MLKKIKINDRFVNKYITLIALFAVSIFLLLKFVFFTLKNTYREDPFLINVFLDPISSLTDSIMTAALAAIVLFVMKDTIARWFQRTVRTIHFSDLNTCVKLLAEEIDTFNKNIQSAHITTHTPILFSQKLAEHILSSNDNPNLNNTKQDRLKEANKYIEIYNSTFKKIVESANGAYDKTVLGKTYIPTLDDATLNLLTDIYGLNDSHPPGTCELSFHNNIGDYAIFIFSEINQKLISEPGKFKFMLFVHFANDYKSLCGFICFDQPTIQQHYEFLKLRKINVEAKIVENETTQTTNSEWATFRDKLKQFFNSKDEIPISSKR